MRLTTRLGPDGAYWWTMVRSPEDPRPVARGTHGYPDVYACAQAAQYVATAAPTATGPVRQDDGGWRWVVTGPDGEPAAESPDLFDCPAFCGYALYEVRHALAGGRTPDQYHAEAM
jgi:hypothetical protein